MVENGHAVWQMNFYAMDNLVALIFFKYKYLM